MTKFIHLPRITPTIGPNIKNLLPKKVQEALTQFQPPDHVTASRQECAYQFLEEVFLPHLLDEDDMNSEWLADQANTFKVRFKASHPKDFSDFALIASIEAKLELLLMSGVITDELHDLLQKGYDLLRFLIDKNEIDLRQI
jgi:hypothetical protein